MVVPALLALSLAGTGPVRTAATGAELVTICHVAGPALVFEIEVDDHAIPGHLVHGDVVGTCGGDPGDPGDPA
jgi:hypothetical protein